MNAERLLAHYERIVDAPDAIARLRRFILDLAVRGKLVPQVPNDEPASELVKRIVKEKERLVNAGEIRKRDDLPEIDEVDVPFYVPSIWRWCRLGNLGSTQTGTTPPKAKPEYYGEHIPFIKPGDIYSGHVDYSNEGLSKIGIDESGRLARPGSILMVCIGTIGKCQRIDRDCSFNQQINSLSLYGETESRYLLIACQSEFFQKSAWAASARTTIAILNKGNWELLPLPLPPLAEQHRIVAKVDELMALCDRLERARRSREAVRDRLTAASLARLNAPDRDTFLADGRFALDALSALSTRSDQINLLRQTILNLAVRGKLVPEDPTAEPAEKLLTNARVAKTALRAARRISRDEDPEFSQSLGENNSPQHWSWGFLADFALVLGGKRLPAGAEFSAEPTDHIYIRVTDMKGGTILAENIKYISAEVHRQIAKYTIDKEDIYVTIAGTIGDVGEVPPFFDGHNLTENAAKIVFREIDKSFLIMALRSDDVQSQFSEKTKQMAQPKLALKRILGARVPIPPLAEQHRIVAKVDALMALCDRLEANLTATATTRRRLLDALLAEALAPAEDRELEAAE